MVEFTIGQSGQISLLEVWGSDRSGRRVHMGYITHSGNYSPSKMMTLDIAPEDLRLIADRCIQMKAQGV